VSLLDARELEPGAAVDAEICVVGAGAAGITLALELARRSADVLLVESGGEEADPETQALHDLDSVGYPVREHFMSRARYYGGSCNLWAGRSMRLLPEDVAAPQDLPGAGWPIPHAEIVRHYDRAAEILRLPAITMFDPGAYQERMTAAERRLFDAGPLAPTVSLWARRPMRFGAVYRSQLRRAVRVMLHASVTGVRLSPAGDAVEALDAATLDGKRVMVRARTFVLASGGLENARLLLVSRDRQLAGIGNANDLVGRYFMDHPRSVFGRVRLRPGARLPLLRGMPVADGKVQIGMGFSAEERRRRGLLNHYATLEAEFSGYAAAGYQSAVRTAKVLLKKGYAGSRWDVGRSRLGDIPGMIYLLTPKELMPHPLYRVYWNLRNALHPRPDGAARVVVYFCEQPPDRESRVTLGEKRDRLGVPRLELHWRIGPEVTESVLALQETLRQRLDQSGIGDLEPGQGEPRYTDASHHMGTTRMAASPRDGVVDPDCRVHGVGNLYLAGSSVFPSAGHANPTLTIVALALRLADHLRGRG
jgi:choline dehydrogenase-like flavoprotein